MGRKAGKYKKKEDNGSQKKSSIRFDSDNEDMMNDEIDACKSIFLLFTDFTYMCICFQLLVSNYGL